MIYLLGIIPDMWHCINTQVELFSTEVVKLEVHHEKELVENIDQNILGFTGIFLDAGICSIVFCLMSLSNQTITHIPAVYAGYNLILLFML